MTASVPAPASMQVYSVGGSVRDDEVIAAADEPLWTKAAYFLAVLVPTAVLTLYTIAKSGRLAELMEILSDERRDLRTRLGALGRLRRERGPVRPSHRSFEALPGLNLHDLMLLPISQLQRFFAFVTLAKRGDAEALALLLDEIRTRLKYLVDVGLGYLTLDRQSRTLSGGEVQRINLTTALGTSLVNTLFVLDEPSIGLHPRDMHRIIVAMQRLRDAQGVNMAFEDNAQIDPTNPNPEPGFIHRADS